MGTLETNSIADDRGIACWSDYSRPEPDRINQGERNPNKKRKVSDCDILRQVKERRKGEETKVSS